MKESVFSFEEKTTQPLFTYFQIAGKYQTYFKTNPLNIYFWRFQYILIRITKDRIQLSISSTRA